MSDKSDGGTASGVWVPSSPSSSSSDSSDSEPYTKRPESGREGKRKRVPHKTRSPRGGRRAHAKQPKHRSRGRSSHSSAHSNGSSPAASELPESGTEAPESGSTSSMGVSDADAGNDGRGVVALDGWSGEHSRCVPYEQDCVTTYSVRTNTPAHKLNQRINENMSAYTLIPEVVQLYNKTYACTHHGDPRQIRGQGRRPHQNSRKIGCKAQINACAQETGNWEVRKTKQVTDHNHVVSSEAYQEMDVLGNYYWSTTLCGRTQAEGPCIYLAVQAIIQRWKHQTAIVTLPSDILRFPVFVSEWIKANSVWEQLKTAASSMDLETEKLFFFGVMNYDFIHWCDVSANLSNGIRPSADWR
ncbi:hypothetical protein PC119_g15827 [Phytophthora cactorum]|nr:hypothetical protein PC119_g15827 [Phytophthora cactorum]